MKMFKAGKPYFGAAYYPEAWDKEQVDEDIRLMLEMGMNTVRIAEFAWSNMEPAEGVYDFSLMRTVVDKCKKAGIAVIMGTPTATPPAWLEEKYPAVKMVNTHGERMTHGARRHVCPNNKKYRGLCSEIVTRMALEFKDDENIIAWQIDNELYNTEADGRGCCCPDCHAAFIDDMKRKYGFVENLNNAWNNYIFSINYQSFEQLPTPRHDVWTHPSYSTEWMEFQNRSYIAFSDFQADILHKYVHVPVGTDMMPFLGLDYEDMNKKLDVIMFNHYNDSGSLWAVAFWCDYLRNLKDRPFWITETATCWSGSVTAGGQNARNFCIANSWLPLTLGAEANLYWLWRAHWGGHELMHGSVVDSWGRPLHIKDEVIRLAGEFKKASGLLSGTKHKSNGIGLHFSHISWTMYMFQQVVNGFDYNRFISEQIYRPLQEIQLRPDVLAAGASLEGYKLIITPFMLTLEEKELDKRIIKWVNDGGTWVAGPMTDIRTPAGTKYKNAPYGHLEDWTNNRLEFMLPPGESFNIRYTDGAQTETVSLIYEALTAGDNVNILATYADEGGYIDGYAAITETKVGKGRIIMLGALLKPQDFAAFILKLAKESKIEPVTEASPSVVTALRNGEAGELFTAVETANKDAYTLVPFDAENIITGEKYNAGQKLTLDKHDVVLAKKI